MNSRQLIKRSLWFYRRTNTGIVLGVAIATAVLVGALGAGDSVRGSLRQLALKRLGRTEFALESGDRFFRAKLADELASSLNSDIAPAILLRGIAVNGESNTRANNVQILGVDKRFWQIGDANAPDLSTDEAVVNQELAAKLGLKPGDYFLLRIKKDNVLPADVPFISDHTAGVIAVRVKVKTIASDEQFGRFSLKANQVAPLNVYVSLSWLAEAMGAQGCANLMLLADARDLKHINAALKETWRLADAELELRQLPGAISDRNEAVVATPLTFGASKLKSPDEDIRRYNSSSNAFHVEEERYVPNSAGYELVSRRIFLDPPAAEAAFQAIPDARGVLTYFVNELCSGDKSTPYSFVSAPGVPLVQPDMRDDEIIVNEWLAEDIGVKVGDTVQMQFYSIGTARKLEETNATFKVRSIVPIAGEAADKSLMPTIPGLSDAGSCRDWDPGIPIELGKVRPKDEKYWNEYRGTPKAFVTLAAAQRMWGNRFGDLTSVRFTTDVNQEEKRRSRSTTRQTPCQKDSCCSSATLLAEGGSDSGSRVPELQEEQDMPPATECRSYKKRAGVESPEDDQIRTGCSIETAEKISTRIIEKLTLESQGFIFMPVRDEALRAAGQGTDFGQLFVGLSFFIVAAALLLIGLLFVFGVEQRSGEMGTLIAMGFTPLRVRRLLILEGLILAVPGGILGALGGIVYNRIVLYGLGTVWGGAVGASVLQPHINRQTLVIGGVMGIIMAFAAIWLAAITQARKPVAELQKGGVDGPQSVSRPWRISAGIAALSVIGVVVVLVMAGKGAGNESSEVFFAIGTLMLVGMIAACSLVLGRTGCSSEGLHELGLAGLGLRNCARRRGHSLTTIGLLACGIFIVIAVGANRKNLLQDATDRSSGTGGFAFLGETSVPVVHDLNTVDGRRRAGISENGMGGVSFVQMRVREGDDASCLNLNRVEKPGILGVKPDELAKRAAFTFVKTMKPASEQLSGTPPHRNQAVVATPRMFGASGLKPPDGDPEEIGAGIRRYNSLPNLCCNSTEGSVRGWLLLDEHLEDGSIPAIADETVITWGLGKKLGDTVEYMDGQGRSFKVRLVGALANSIFQGRILISEQALIERFPSTEGYRFFLVDVPAGPEKSVSEVLSRSLADYGLDLTPAVRRLAEFNVVENTYLAIFMALGGLGLILGSIGMGIVVMRNVMERRGELALLRAVGFSRKAIRWMVLYEHGFLLAAGVACGLLAAGVAVWPAFVSKTADVSSVALAITVFGVVVNGLFWTILATILATRGDLLPALRKE